MADSKAATSLENVKESKSSTEKRKRFGSAVDKSKLALALRTSTIEESESCEIDNVVDDVPAEEKRAFVETRKGRICLGLILGILLFLLFAGIIIASCLLNQKIEELKVRDEDNKNQIGMVKHCVSPNIGFRYTMRFKDGKVNVPNADEDDYENASEFKTGQDVIFDEKLLDTSSSYDPTTGVFKCPVSGLYQFNLQVGVVANLAMLSLKLNGGEKYLSTSLADDRGSKGNWDTASSSVTVKLTKGETVGVVQVYSGNTYLVEQKDATPNLNTFSGYLIRSSDCDF